MLCVQEVGRRLLWGVGFSINFFVGNSLDPDYASKKSEPKTICSVQTLGGEGEGV